VQIDAQKEIKAYRYLVIVPGKVFGYTLPVKRLCHADLRSRRKWPTKNCVDILATI
jgi:hypothetical protein